MERYIYQVAPEQGAKVVAIGGGTGLSTMLRGLKLYTKNLTAIVTVADDGGGSGVLRQEMGMPPPGDIRHCMEALANVEPLMGQLLQYRFKEGGLTGQSFGNLILAALNGIMPTFDQAVEAMSQVLAITGRILPVTTENVLLEAEFENGATVLGESHICLAKKEQDCRIRRVRLLPENPPALQAAITAIEEAEMIIFAPGSLYTSIIPNLLVDGIVDAVRRSDALKVYACNIMTEAGETEGYTVSDHIRALFRHSYAGLFNLCLTNSASIPQAVLQRYHREGASVTFCDKEACEALGVEIVTRPVATVENGCVRHNPGHLARELMNLHAERTIRIADRSQAPRYQRER
ncbi:MAG: YvcK family protein [Ruminococcaceae bacterium]|nr:YvcK family protein [Oscillospiraceae bacterium]